MSAANPYTAALLDGLARRDERLDAFVQHWDRVEALVVDVYRRSEATNADEAEWLALRAWLNEPRHELPLNGAGTDQAGDPFATVLHNLHATAFVGNRVALKALPAAREVLNTALLSAWQAVANDPQPPRA